MHPSHIVNFISYRNQMPRDERLNATPTKLANSYSASGVEWGTREGMRMNEADCVAFAHKQYL